MLKGGNKSVSMYFQKPAKKRSISIKDKLKCYDMVKQNLAKKIIMDQFCVIRRTITCIASKEAELKAFKADKTVRKY